MTDETEADLTGATARRRPRDDDQIAGRKLKPSTRMMGHGYDPMLSEGSLKPPIFLTSTFVFPNAAAGKRHFEGVTGKRPGGAEGLVYSRFNGPDQEILEDRLSVWEEAEDALAGFKDLVDLGQSIRHHLPWMAGIIVAVMLVLLFLAFGSVVLPIKAVAMNLLSLGAAFGVVTWIFADGHLEGALDYTSTGFLDMTQPIFMLAILVGLSMDYEVFLLSRVREQWDSERHLHLSPTERNTHAVAIGLQKTGRIITSAALLLAVVIGAFSTSGIVFMKMIGVGMLVALLVDATIVRALLVPATMKLLGTLNWWAPRPLRRFWERYGVRESIPVATRELETASS